VEKTKKLQKKTLKLWVGVCGSQGRADGGLAGGQ
jgi:hypothetical protein